MAIEGEVVLFRTRRDECRPGLPGQEQQRCNDQDDRCKGGERHEDERSAAGISSAGRCGDDPSLGSPGGSERTRIKGTASEELLGGDAFGLGFC